MFFKQDPSKPEQNRFYQQNRPQVQIITYLTFSNSKNQTYSNDDYQYPQTLFLLETNNTYENLQDFCDSFRNMACRNF